MDARLQVGWYSNIPPKIRSQMRSLSFRDYGYMRYFLSNSKKDEESTLIGWLEDGDVLCAWCSVYFPIERKKKPMFNIYTRKIYRGKGYSIELLRQMVSRIQRIQRKKKIVLEVAAHDARSNAFFKKAEKSISDLKFERVESNVWCCTLDSFEN